MFMYQYLTLYFIGALYFSVANSQNNDIVVDIKDDDMYIPKIPILDQFPGTEGHKVDIKMYNESLCPGSRMFMTEQYKPAVEKLNKYLDIHIYPYGNAETIEKDGDYEFKCQHGPPECYGNKLHACAIDILNNSTQAVIYNSCMMEPARSKYGSDDTAADECGQRLNIKSKPIKSCAKGDMGVKLLKYYGDESKKANFQYVPYVLINGVPNLPDDNFMKPLCAAFTSPPPPCKQANYSDLIINSARDTC